MKRILFAIVALVASTLSFAGSPVRVTLGSIPALTGKRVFVEFDYSKMVVLDEDSKKTMTIQEFCKLKGEDWVRDMGKDDVAAEDDVREVLGKKLNKVNFVNDKSQADYVLVIKTLTFSYGNPFALKGFMPKDVLGFFVGDFTIKDANGTSVAEMSCKKVNGPGGMTWTQQKRRVYIKVAKVLASALKKAK